MSSVTDHLPRFPLAQLPTPVQNLPNLTRHLNGPEIFIKRDDQTGLATGGNKTRKLEFLIAEAQQAGADVVITAGSTQSNHARQTAAAAARAGLECHLVLHAPGGQPPQTLTGNILLDDLLGAHIHWTPEKAPYSEGIANVEASLRVAGRTPHVIPYGGSNALGLMGYVTAIEELAAQMQGQPPFDAIVYATSSGGTQAGMVLGAKVAGLIGRTRLIGISVDEPREALSDRVRALAMAGAQLVNVNLTMDDLDQVIDVRTDYLGGGYAVIGRAEIEAIRLLARSEGILIDPVYTGRAFAGLLDLIRKEELTRDQRVLFWHTGGSAALFAFTDELGRKDNSVQVRTT